MQKQSIGTGLFSFMRTFLLFLFIIQVHIAFCQKHSSGIWNTSKLSLNFPLTRFDTSGGTQTMTYAEAIEWWKKLDAASPFVKMLAMGPTDAGYPLHLVLISTDKDFNIASLKKKNKVIILINNGIHPGEPDGIDASMLLVKQFLQPEFILPYPDSVKGPTWINRNLPDNVVLAIIPVYNIGGSLNRSSNYRIDQNGPVEKGFRGNAQNLDLNRDFIKMDSKNAFTFAKIFHYLDPDIFIDNHVSDGADYQHVMTLLASQHNKLGGALGEYMNKTFEPALYPLMKTKGFDLVPYVNDFGETPDGGWPEFWDSPRYSSGYAALWNTFSFLPETHMLKPYKQRVEATKALLESFIEFAALYGKEIIALRREAAQSQQQQTAFPIAWKWDKTKATEITFKGYEAAFKKSEVSGLNRLYYDRSKPYEKPVPFYNTYVDTLHVQKPIAFIIPQGWWRVIERLAANNIRMRRLPNDTTLEVEAYRIENYSSGAKPYEGHHPNSNVKVSKEVRQVAFRRGDYVIPSSQKGVRFLMETLEPQGEDSYFAWNFFDSILGQKEGFSDYVFEETANEYLKNNPAVRRELDERKKIDSAFANSAYAQLDFVYKHSPYYEKEHLRYPVYRLMK